MWNVNWMYIRHTSLKKKAIRTHRLAYLVPVSANRPAAYFESKAFMDDFVYRYWDYMKHCGWVFLKNFSFWQGFSLEKSNIYFGWKHSLYRKSWKSHSQAKPFAWHRVISRLIAEEASWSPMAEHEAEPLRMKGKIGLRDKTWSFLLDGTLSFRRKLLNAECIM